MLCNFIQHAYDDNTDASVCRSTGQLQAVKQQVGKHSCLVTDLGVCALLIIVLERIEPNRQEERALLCTATRLISPQVWENLYHQLR